MKTGYVLRCGEMFFGTLIGNCLTLTSNPDHAWFTDDAELALFMSQEMEKKIGLMCVVCNHTHGGKRRVET